MRATPTWYENAGWDFSWLKQIEIALRRHLRIGLRVIITFDIHVVDQSHGQQVQIPDGYPQLHTPEQEQRRRQLPLGCGPFFLLTDWVCTFSPHSSMISGSTW